jgi:hypothetical protein
VSVWPDWESDAWICKLTAEPVVEVWLPGLVTVTVLPPDALTVQLKVVLPAAPVASVAVTLTDWFSTAAVGVPEIKPAVETDNPAGNPVALNVNVWPLAESVAPICKGLMAVPCVDVWLPGLVTVIVFEEKIECATSQPPDPPLKSLAHMDWMANDPVARVMFWDAPWPDEIHAHLSPISYPLESVQPPAGNWSVMVSAYSCPPTIVTPSRLPAEPALTKFAPQLAPASVT